MKKLYEKPNAEFLSFHLLHAVANMGGESATTGRKEDDGFDDPDYQFDGPGPMN